MSIPLKVTLIREVVDIDPSGNHSVKRTEFHGATLTWDDPAPVPLNAPYVLGGEWRVLMVHP